MVNADRQKQPLSDRLRELTLRFTTRLPERLATIEAALQRLSQADGNIEEIKRHFHSLAGTAGTYRVYDIAAIAREAEEVCLAASSIDAAYVAQLEVLIAGIRHATNAHLAELERQTAESEPAETNSRTGESQGASCNVVVH